MAREIVFFADSRISVSEFAEEVLILNDERAASVPNPMADRTWLDSSIPEVRAIAFGLCVC